MRNSNRGSPLNNSIEDEKQLVVLQVHDMLEVGKCMIFFLILVQGKKKTIKSYSKHI